MDLHAAWHSVKRQPIRVIEALIIAAAGLGYAIDPETTSEILTELILGVGVLLTSLETAQSKLTPVNDPDLEHTVPKQLAQSANDQGLD